jgi:ABC-type uncharacterized transport system involved in gliding motility auxiliary subunit
MTKDSLIRMASLAGYTLVVVLILALVNIISFRRYSRIDLTEEGTHSLSPQTKKIMASLDQKVTVRAFIRPERNKEASAFFERYKYFSPKFGFEIIDPDKSPAMAKKYNVTAYDAYVLETESGRREAATRLTEEEITGKLVRATTGKQKKIYVLTGHGERGLEDTKPMGWAGVKSALISSMFLVEPLNWFEKGEIPKDADLLIIPGPRDDFQEAEIKRLREYLVDGGRLLFTLDPGKRPALEGLLREYGVAYDDDMILDPVSQRLGFDALVATVSSLERGHPVAADIKEVCFFTVARSIKVIKENPAKAETRPIGATSTQSWGETNMASIDAGKPEFNDKEDPPGPLTVAASAEWSAGPGRGELKLGQEQGKGRLVAVGDSDFAANSTLAMSANKDLFLNMASWLVESENQISIRPKKPKFNPIMLSREQLAVIFWGCVVIMPAAAAITGALVVARRKRP